jgi:methenyltetrahydrofolate cyclohydrolase
MAERDRPADRQMWTIADYAAAVASGQPTPGGGSVVATVAALAAGLAEMVCQLTLARPVEPNAASRLTEAQGTAAGLRRQFLKLALEDERAYGAYRNAAGLPKSTVDEREVRRHGLESALERSASAPIRVATGCVELLTTLESVGALGTKHALTDVRTSLRLAEAALKGAFDLIEANTELMRDRDHAARLDRDAQTLLARGEQASSAVNRILDTQR